MADIISRLEKLKNISEYKKTNNANIIANIKPIYSTQGSNEEQKLKETKQEWRNFCEENYKYLELFDISPNIQKTHTLNAVFVETRKLKNIGFVILNTILKLQDKCCYTIVCGNKNVDYINQLNFKLNGILNIINLGVDDLSVNEYNHLFKKKEFWNSLKGDKILIYQEDSCIFKDNIEDFIFFDFIGAPWQDKQKENPLNVGNGGFSLRSKETMLRVIDLNPSMESLHLSKTVKNIVKKFNFDTIPEDVYFSNAIIYNDLGHIPDKNIAIKFSQESVFSNNENLGGHCWWNYDVLLLRRKYNFNNAFLKIFKCSGIEFSYNVFYKDVMERMCKIIEWLTEKKYIVIIFTTNDFSDIFNHLKKGLTGKALNFIKCMDATLLFNSNFIYDVKSYLDYFINMNDLRLQTATSFFGNENVMDLYTETGLKLKPTHELYINNIYHRGGWRFVLNSLENFNFFSEESDVHFIDTIEHQFLWPKIPGYTCRNKWCGIMHCTPNTPEHVRDIDIELLFVNEQFLESLHYCFLVITLSTTLVDYLRRKFASLGFNIPIICLKHPVVKENIKLFDIKKYHLNSNKKLIQLGQQLRKVTSIYNVNIPDGFKKYWLTGSPDKTWWDKLLMREIKALGMNPNILDNDVTKLFIESFLEYDQLLAENIVFIDLFDAAANNTIVECIVRNTPVIVNKLPGVVEYLGEDYPLYFNTLDDVKEILSNNDKIYAAYYYLYNKKDKHELSFDYFYKALVSGINNAIISINKNKK
jgi:hypothetical protein